MHQYVLRTGNGSYFAGYRNGTALFGDIADAVTLPSKKEADNLILAFRKGGLHEALLVEEKKV